MTANVDTILTEYPRVARFALEMPAFPAPPEGFSLACFSLWLSGSTEEVSLDDPRFALHRLLENGLSRSVLRLVALDADGVDARSCKFDPDREAWGNWK